MPNLFYFIVPGLGIGSEFCYSRLSQGDMALTNWGVGPQIGYFIDSGTNTIPYLTGGINYLAREDDNGFRFKFVGGILIRKDHMAISFEVGYLFDRLKRFDEPETGNTIAISIGFAGLFYE